MSETVGLQRTAATLRNGDIVRSPDGTEKTVVGQPTANFNGSGGLVISVTYDDGSRQRIGAGEWLDVDRDGGA